MLGSKNKLWHMVRKMRLEGVVVHEISGKFAIGNVGQCGIKVKVTIALATLII